MAYEQLLKALGLVRRFSDHNDVKYLLEYVKTDFFSGKMHGFQGGFQSYADAADFEQTLTAIHALSVEDKAVLTPVLGIMYDLLRPIVNEEARGNVNLTTIKRNYAVIDWTATSDAGHIVYALDEHGQVITEAFYYTYAYVRLSGSRGDGSRKRRKQVVVYADRGMGKGGSGGYIAAALDDGLITEQDVLDAWHYNRLPDEPLTKMSANYENFIDQCKEMLGKPSEEGNTTTSDELESESKDHPRQSVAD